MKIIKNLNLHGMRASNYYNSGNGKIIARSSSSFARFSNEYMELSAGIARVISFHYFLILPQKHVWVTVHERKTSLAEFKLNSRLARTFYFLQGADNFQILVKFDFIDKKVGSFEKNERYGRL